MTAATAPVREHGLAVGDVAEIPISAVRAPHHSVIQWLIAAGAPKGAQSAFASMIALATPPGSTRVVSALGQPTLTQLPDYLVPLPPLHDSSVEDDLDAVRNQPAEELAREVSGWSSSLPPAWRSAVDEPAQWRDDFADAASAAWAMGRGYWESGRYAIDREIGRIGTAVVTGTVPALLNSLHPRLSYAKGVIRFRNSCPTTVPLAGRRLVLVPVLTAPHRLVVSFERPDVAYIAYPVLDPPRPMPGGGDRLELVLGPLRAAALRRLGRPLSMQALADEIHCAASTATYHCDLLDAAGLVTRERRGAIVWVMRTRTGDELIELLS